jgi:hypothetical protein
MQGRARTSLATFGTIRNLTSMPVRLVSHADPHADHEPHDQVRQGIIKEWGHQGSGPGEVSEPHGTAMERGTACWSATVRTSRIQTFGRLPQLIEPERALWRLDHEINCRKIPIDRRLPLAVADLAKKQRIAINAEIAALTDGKIGSANQRDKIIKSPAENGCEIDGLTKADVKRAGQRPRRGSAEAPRTTLGRQPSSLQQAEEAAGELGR